MARKRLTDRSVRAFRVKRGQRVARVFDKVTTGLALQATQTGSRAYYFVYSDRRRKRWYWLGELKDLSLADARAEVQKLRSGRLDGIDPVLERRRALGAKTFDQLAKTFVEHLREKGKKSWRNYWRVLVGGALPDARRTLKKRKKTPGVVALGVLWKDRPLDSITRGDVRDAVLTVAKRAPIHANRVLAATRQAFNFALERDWIANSPCTAVKAPTEERTRTRVLDDAEIRKLWAALDKERPVIRDVVRVLLLTAARSAEVFQMRWTELDSTGWWTLPETRTKNNLPHRVFLAKSVRDILEKRHEKHPDGQWIFPSPKAKGAPLGSIAKAIARLRKNTGVAFRPHDLRRTAATLMPRAGVPELTIPKVLGHRPAGVTRRHYDLHGYDLEKKLAWEMWAKEVDRILTERDEEKRTRRAKVVPLFSRAESA